MALNSLGAPSDIAATAVYLASDDAATVNGTSLVDDRLTARQL